MSRSPPAVAGIGAIAILAHVVSMRAGWVLDDWELFVDNPYLRSASGLPMLLRHEMFVASGESRYVPYYRPLSSLVYWITYQLFGDSAFLQHAFNALLHAVAAMLLFTLVRRASASVRAAALSATVFAAHPITAEEVAYLGGRQDVMGWCFVLLTAIALTRARRPLVTAGLAFGGSLAAALCREFFFATPPLLAVIAIAGATDARARRRGALLAGSGSAAAVLAALALRRLLDIAPFRSEPSSIGELAGAAAAVLLRLAKDVVAPTDIAMNVTLRPLSPALAVLVLLGAIAIIGVGTKVVASRSAGALALYAFGALVFAAVVALHTAVALRSSVVSDRYAYGVLLAFACMLAPLVDGPLARAALLAKPKVFPAVVAGLALALVPLTWARAADFSSEEQLQRAMIRERPDDPQSWLAEAALLRAEGRKEEAYPLCIRYAEACPRSTTANACVAEEALSRKDYARAVVYLERWVYEHPHDAAARATYFDALFRTHDLARVKAALDAFETLVPDAPDVRAARKAYDRATQR